MTSNKYLYILCIALIISMSGCSSAKNSSSSPTQYADSASMSGSANAGYFNENSVAMEAEVAYDTGGGQWHSNGDTAGSAPAQTSKIIKTGNINMETDHFDSVAEAVKNAVVDRGGYIENGSMRTTDSKVGASRYYNATLRVPAEDFDTLKTYIEGLAKVLYTDESMDNVTSAYYDIQSRLRTRQTEEQRVLDMIDRATKIDDLINLEQRLGEIRTDIELYLSQINNIDNASRYSTIYLSLTEVTSEEMLVVSDDLAQRISSSFTKSVNVTAQILQEIIIFLAGTVIPLSVIAFLTAIGIVVVKKGKKKS